MVPCEEACDSVFNVVLLRREPNNSMAYLIPHIAKHPTMHFFVYPFYVQRGVANPFDTRAAGIISILVWGPSGIEDMY